MPEPRGNGMCLVGVILENVSDTQLQYGALLQSANDALGAATLVQTNKSLSKITNRICRLCDATSDTRHVVEEIGCEQCTFTLMSTEAHMRDQEIVLEHPELQKYFGQNGLVTAFAGIVPGMQFRFVEYMPFDHIMHGEAEGYASLLLESYCSSLDHTSTIRHMLALSAVFHRLLKAHCRPVLLHLISSSNHLLTTRILNGCLRDFKWMEEDRSSIPEPVREVLNSMQGCAPSPSFAWHRQISRNQMEN